MDARTDVRGAPANEERGTRGGTDRGGRGDVVAANAVVEETKLIDRESVIVELDLVNHASQ
jgi:hypothetical protein